MASLNPFQLYSQKENTITNNILFLFSSIYDINPHYYEEYINSLIEDNNRYQITPLFRQQIGNKGNGIIDGHIKTNASSIIIETKIDGLEWIDKLLKYTDSFEKDELKILFHLSSKKYPQHLIDDINKKLKASHLDNIINFHSLTYEDLERNLESLAELYSYSEPLNKLAFYFKDYCIKSDLMPKYKHILRAMACGQSFDLNMEHQFYFDIADRGYSHFKYLGIYKNKSVQAIGLIENVIVADLDKNNQLTILENRHKVTKKQEDRLIEAIKAGIADTWDIATGMRFFLLKDFHRTNFKKISSGGIFRVRYFDLTEFLNPIPKNTEEIAKALDGKEWE